MSEEEKWIQPDMLDPENDETPLDEALPVTPELKVVNEKKKPKAKTDPSAAVGPQEERQKMQSKLDELKAELERLEKHQDEGVLPSAAFWHIEDLKDRIKFYEKSLYEPVSIYEVPPDEFIEHFEVYYKQYLADPFGPEGQRFEGIVRLVRKKEELLRRIENNPFFMEYLKHSL